MVTLERTLPYTIKNVQPAIYDVLDMINAEYDDEPKQVVAEAKIYGNTSKFSVAVRESGFGATITLTMLAPCPGLSVPGQHRALNAVADHISQHLENVLVLNGMRTIQPSKPETAESINQTKR